jgi:AAT family amino acid transporter/D-serine/D-alanine/glycine transporter
VSQRHVPSNAISISTAVMLIGVPLNYLAPGQVFEWVTSVSVIGALWTWGMIMFAHLRFRQAVAAGRVKAGVFRMPGGPIANWGVIGFMLLIAAFFGLDESTWIALYVAPIWFGMLAIGYRMIRQPQLAAAE